MNRTNRKLRYNNYYYFEVQGCVKNYFTHQFLPIDFRGEGSPVLRHSYRFTRSNEAAKKLLLLVSPSAQVTPLCFFAWTRGWTFRQQIRNLSILKNNVACSVFACAIYQRLIPAGTNRFVPSYRQTWPDPPLRKGKKNCTFPWRKDISVTIRNISDSSDSCSELYWYRVR